MKRQWFLMIGVLVIICSSGVLADENSDFTTATPAPVLATNLAGSETRLLPANYDIWSCDWAPDGKGLVFAAKMQGEDATKMKIWYWALDPVSDPVPLTNTEQLIDSSPRWSLNGSKIAMTRRSFNNSNSTNLNSSIWIKEIPGGVGKQITSGPEDRDPAWAPDGNKIVFSRGQGPYRAQLSIANLVDNTVQSVLGQEGELLNSPWWGRDGKIYYTKLTPAPKNVVVSGQTYQVMDFGRGGIWALNPVTNEVEPIVVDEFDNRLPALSPDGSRLVFVSNRISNKDGNGKFDRGSLYLKNMVTGNIYFVTNKVGLNGGSLSWSPDGKKLAFFTFRSIRPAVWVISIP